MPSVEAWARWARAECIVDVDLGERGEGLGEGGIVGFLFGVIAKVLKQEDLTGFKLAGELFCDFADAIGREGHIDGVAQLFVEQLTQADDDGTQRVLGIRLALGTAEVRGEDDLGAVAESIFNGG